MTTNLTALATVALCLAACSSATNADPPPQSAAINPCVTAGASYVVHFAERASGQCGPVPDAIVNTEPNGTVTTPGGCSGEDRTDGCVVTLTNWSCPISGGGQITESGQITWQQGGAGAGGTAQYTIKAPNGTSCISTYDVTYRRQ